LGMVKGGWFFQRGGTSGKTMWTTFLRDPGKRGGENKGGERMRSPPMDKGKTLSAKRECSPRPLRTGKKRHGADSLPKKKGCLEKEGSKNQRENSQLMGDCGAIKERQLVRQGALGGEVLLVAGGGGLRTV